MLKYLKYPNQTILDFVLTHYGSVDNLFDFLADGGLTNSDDFYNAGRFFKLPLIPNNEVNTFYSNNGIIVGSDDQTTYFTEFTYNNDLNFKSIILGDYNSDFSNDFDIAKGLTVITVGYQGMTLTVEFSVNNIGSLRGVTSGTVVLDNGILPISKDYSVTIGPNATSKVSVEFYNLQYGEYDVILTSSNPVISETKTIGVLGKPVFTCNNDLAIIGIPTLGGTVTMRWSITNTGNRDGFYQGFSYYVENGYEDYNISISVGQTYTFNRVITLNQAISTFFSSCSEQINITI